MLLLGAEDRFVIMNIIVWKIMLDFATEIWRRACSAPFRANLANLYHSSDLYFSILASSQFYYMESNDGKKCQHAAKYTRLIVTGEEIAVN